MQSLVLQVDDSVLPSLQDFLAQFPVSKVSVKRDPIAVELAKRVQQIDDGQVQLIPLKQGMDNLRTKLKAHYESGSNA